MKLTAFVAATGLVQASLASAIPGLEHQRLHVERRDPVPAVKTVTTTFYQTVIWVDGNGNPVSTQINTPPPSAASRTSTKPASHAALPSVNGLVKSVTPAGIAAKPQRPTQAAQATASSQPSFQPSNLPSSSVAPASTGGTKGGNTGSTGASNAAPGGMGICYDMINSQTQCKDPGTINTEFSFLRSQGYGIVRIYDIGCPIGDFTAAAAQNGLKLMVGINAIANLQGDLGKLVGMVAGNWGSVDTVYIGNELVNNGAASASQVADAVSQAKGILNGAGFTGSVVTVDTFNQMINNPTICSTSDYCAANAHAFFDPNTAATGAGNFVLNAYNSVASANSGKRVVISESGWPWQGSCNGQACPSVENQKAAMNSIMSSFGGMPGNVFMFQAYDAGYKQPGPQGVEQFFGIYDSDHYTGGIGNH